MHPTGKYCPLDGTEIYTHIEHGGSENVCSSCETDYKGILDFAEGMLERARSQASNLGIQISESSRRINEETRRKGVLEELLRLAEEKGLLTRVNP